MQNLIDLSGPPNLLERFSNVINRQENTFETIFSAGGVRDGRTGEYEHLILKHPDHLSMEDAVRGTERALDRVAEKYEMSKERAKVEIHPRE